MVDLPAPEGPEMTMCLWGFVGAIATVIVENGEMQCRKGGGFCLGMRPRTCWICAAILGEGKTMGEAQVPMQK